MASISIEAFGLKEMMGLLNVDISEIADKWIFDTAADLENKSSELLDKRIYQTSKSNALTGTAKGSVLNESVGSGGSRRVKRDTRIKWLHKKGKKINYAPFLNKNRRVPHNNTGFWDDAVAEVIDKAPAVGKKHLEKTISKKTYNKS